MQRTGDITIVRGEVSEVDRLRGYPPERREHAVRAILVQTELLCNDWAAWPGPTPRVQRMIAWVYDGERAAAPS